MIGLYQDRYVFRGLMTELELTIFTIQRRDGLHVKQVEDMSTCRDSLNLVADGRRVRR